MSVKNNPTGRPSRVGEATLPTMVIKPASGLAWPDPLELWRYRELIYFLSLRDVMVRYKQTAVGIGWALIQPVGMMLVFTLFFGRLAKLPSEGVPYSIFVFAGLLPWQTFSRGINEGANSLVADQRLISRIYFPRLIVPLSIVLASLADFIVAFLVYLGLMVYFGVFPTLVVWTLPLFVMLMVITSVAVSLWFSALNIEYRDVRYLMVFLAQLWLFVTPVIYPSSFIPQKWHLIYGLNPMAGVVEGFRWALLGVGPGPGPLIWVSVVVAMLMFVTGWIFFKSRERIFADIVGSGGR